MLTRTWSPTMSRLQHVAAALCLALLLSACKHAPPPPAPPKPRVLTLTVVSAADLNPDPRSGLPSPVVVRLYQLSSTTDFANAEFDAVYPNDNTTLAKTMVSKQQFTALPGEHTTIQVEFANEARALGVLVAYGDNDHANWRVLSAATSGSSTLSLGAKSAQLVSSP